MPSPVMPGPVMPGPVIRSAAIAIGLTWSLRLIGLVSVFILARLLTPEDFGVIALAAAVMALVDTFSNIGLYQALLRTPDPTRAHYDTAWTIRLMLMTGLGVVMAASAPLAASFFEQPVLIALIPFLALQFLFTGLANIGVVEFDRNMEFGRDLRMRLSVRLASLVLTIIAAVVLRSYWALAIGVVVQSAAHTIATYLFHPYRPRLSLAQRNELMGFSLWVFAGYAAQVVHHQAERIAVGRIAPAPVVGLYSVSKDLCAIFTLEIATALNRVTFVTTARDSRPLAEQEDRLKMMLGAYALIVAPIGLGLAVVAEDALAVLLGPQWLGAAPLLAVMAPASACYAVHKLIASTLQASGQPARAAVLSGSGALAMVLGVGAAALAGFGAQAIAQASLVMNALVLMAGTGLLARLARVSWRGMLGALARPFMAAAGMAALVLLAGFDTGMALVDLAANVLLGALAYAGLVLALWRIAGLPAGAEQHVRRLLAEYLRGRPASPEQP
ncbi:MAG: polysaccharide transporter, PST family [Porphyrobacter sp. HL-46]|nr:MAG: polysaccharide transporter, PST family [Porphyrobacter sp. HL-46]